MPQDRRISPQAQRQTRENKATSRAHLENNNLVTESLVLFSNSCILAKQELLM